MYDGAGGCDLLHDKRQIADQTLDRGNLAFTGNFKLQIPVRVTRKNKCPESYTKRCATRARRRREGGEGQGTGRRIEEVGWDRKGT